MPVVEGRKTQAVLKEVTVLYPHLFKPHNIPGSEGPAKYGLVVLLPPSFDLKSLQTAMLTAAQGKWGEENGKSLLMNKRVKLPIRKQQEMAEQGKAGFTDEEGHLFFNTSSEQRPGVVDGNLDPVIEEELFYSGVVCNVQINVFAWEHKLSGKGLSFDLLNVQRVKDGPKLANAKPNPASAFDKLEAQDNEGGGASTDDALQDVFGR